MLTLPTPQIALLIDADNVSGLRDVHLAKLLAQLESLGTVTLRRAYGHWGKPNLTPLAKVLHRFAILPIQQFDYSSGKNATDIALTIDAIDLLHSGAYGAFALVTCDSDFTPLVVRLRTSNTKVYGFGWANKTSQAFQESCSGFFVIEDPKGAALAQFPGSESAPSAILNPAIANHTESSKISPSEDSAATITPIPVTGGATSETSGQSTLAKTTPAKTAATAAISNKATLTETPKPIEEVFKEAITTNLKNGWAKAPDIGAFLAKHKKLKKNYNTQTWAKYYQRFPHLFEVKKVNGSTSVRLI
jgi:hypothetical protein